MSAAGRAVWSIWLSSKFWKSIGRVPAGGTPSRSDVWIMMSSMLDVRVPVVALRFVVK
jgi:hypothetical protein